MVEAVQFHGGDGKRLVHAENWEIFGVLFLPVVLGIEESRNVVRVKPGMLDRLRHSVAGLGHKVNLFGNWLELVNKSNAGAGSAMGVDHNRGRAAVT